MHELVAAFEDEGLPLHRTLVAMLGEDPSHRTERRGCGYTQATRFLSTHVNQRRAGDATAELDVFCDWPQASTRVIAQEMLDAGWASGWRRLHEAPASIRDRDCLSSPAGAALLGLSGRIARARARLSLLESGLLADMIADLISGDGALAPELPAMPIKPEIGSCSQAEEFFLEIAHGRVRRHGHVNLVIGADGRALMLEKMNLGESHSAIALEPLRINGVGIPPGGLFALRYDEPADPPPTPHGRLIPLSGIAEARFLRLTTLSVPPEIRRRAFSAQVDAQLHARMVSPLTTTLDNLREYAALRLRQNA